MSTKHNAKKDENTNLKSAIKGVQIAILIVWILVIIAAGSYIFHKVSQGNELSEYTMLITTLALLSGGILIPIFVLGRIPNK